MTETECHDADEQATRALLAKHRYDPDAVPCGSTYRPLTSTYRNSAGVLLRSHVCELDGVPIDGHEGSDLDPGSTSCIHCDYEGSNP
jgi:hypothetical protein